ncbi:hypothetical protein QYM36_001148 [Artemia franciscana]|uniref:Uncharacterized protein n=1 Tax=Artemia franciscana TaxID=6661 RepID=A0AA88IDB5_ARTSF|nr:hypothetical protein QYM36_001148 [Artemia franciscana]
MKITDTVDSEIFITKFWNEFKRNNSVEKTKKNFSDPFAPGPRKDDEAAPEHQPFDECGDFNDIMKADSDEQDPESGIQDEEADIGSPSIERPMTKILRQSNSVMASANLLYYVKY